MSVRFAAAYVDRLFKERDLDGLYHLISAVENEVQLPEEFWVFCRVYELVPSRSGIWQHYEGLSETEFKRMSEALDRHGLVEVARQYRHGRSTWGSPTQAEDVDEWLGVHTQEIYDAAFSLIVQKKEWLSNES